MNTKTILKKVATLLLVGTVLLGTTACASKNTADEGSRTIKVAVAPGYFPITYADDDGNAAGYDVEVFKAIDELLPEYTFVYEVVDKETMNVGVQTGTYQVGINSMFKTDDRLETYIMPENNMGYTAVGCLYREGEEHITSFEDIYNRQLRIHPNHAAGSIQKVLEAWTAAHPETPLEIEVISVADNNEGMDSVRANEYDVFFQLIPVINLWPEESKVGLAVSDPLEVVPTFPIINKGETQLNDQINTILADLDENGTLSQLSVDAFGYDVFSLSNN
ncbi:MAG: transporter substrate-binding domain-containing protein [Clostridium sp.]|nr:transporter substrate-binding domain-containing protein [Clostridium sp.]